MHGRRGNSLRPCQHNYPFIGRLFFVFDSSNSASTTSSSSRCLQKHQHRSLLLGMLLLGDFHQFLGNLCQFLHFRFDSGFVFTFQSSFQCSQRRLDSSFVVSRQFVACFFNLLTGAVQQMVARLRVCTSSSTYGQLLALASASRTISGFHLRSDQKKP